MILVAGAAGSNIGTENTGTELAGLPATSGEPVRALVRKPPPSPLDGPRSLLPAESVAAFTAFA